MFSLPISFSIEFMQAVEGALGEGGKEGRSGREKGAESIKNVEEKVWRYFPPFT